MKIYLASSWKHLFHDEVYKFLCGLGYDVYNYRQPTPAKSGFSWKEVSDKDYKDWSFDEYLFALNHESSDNGFNKDIFALENSDICILLQPSGLSAHLELGYAAGLCSHTIIYYPTDLYQKANIPLNFDKDLMVKMAEQIVTNLAELNYALSRCGDIYSDAEKMVGG